MTELTFPQAMELQRTLSKALQERPEFKDYQFGISESQEGKYGEPRWFIVEVSIPINDDETA